MHTRNESIGMQLCHQSRPRAPPRAALSFRVARLINKNSPRLASPSTDPVSARDVLRSAAGLQSPVSERNARRKGKVAIASVDSSFERGASIDENYKVDEPRGRKHL